jgi:aminopeptidase N
MTTVPRLYEQFIPTHYDLSLSLERPERVFTGTVTIKGAASGYSIRLHAKDLTITSVLIDGTEARATYTDEFDELLIESDGLKPGNHVLVLGFEGTITDGMHGLYPSSFEHNGVKKELLATQFESHHAREVFPCVDEPEAKATFDLTLTTETGITALSNMPIDWQREEDGNLVTAFKTTPRMSTYLLAWVTGELHRKTAQTSSGVEVNVWATPAQSPESLDFALDIATRSIEFYDEYFGTAYPLPKSDHVALPDFSSGAMENWGLITYREIALLSDPATSSISTRQYIATVIAHELAHQWFGNLVTMKWWNNLWLNESFATLMEYLAVDALHPEWNVWLDFASGETIAALRRDALHGVQPVQTEVNHPDEINSLFDGAIVYAKGARLLHMLRQYIGNDAFQSGLKAYFAKYAYKNTEAKDLWDAFTTASGHNIEAMMGVWISQPGYPVVHIDQIDRTVHLRQEQFFIGEHPSSDALWPIPLDATCSELPAIFDVKETEVTRTHTSLLQLNKHDSSHFITHYSDSLRQGLLAAVASNELDTVNRLSLLNEATLLARGGYLRSAELLPYLKSYTHETSEPVWGIISLTLAELRKFVEENPDAEYQLRELSGKVAREQYENLGWDQQEGETEEQAKLRAIVVGLTLYSEEPSAITEAKRRYDQGLETLNPELRPAILSSVVRHESDELALSLLDLYPTVTNAELSQDICSGLTSTRSASVIDTILTSLQNAAIIRPQDVGRWFAYLIRNRYAREKTWDWLTSHWEWIEETFGGDKSFDYFPQYAASGLMTQVQLDAYIEFFTPKRSIPSLTRVIDLGIVEIKARVALLERDGPAVIEALTKKRD